MTCRALISFGFGFLLCLGGATAGQNLQEQFEKRVTEFTLENGLKFIVAERHEAPVFSYTTYALVGSVDEQRGRTGLAHFFEHMAFKGTRTIGTTNVEAELALFEKQDAIFAQIKSERRKGAKADAARLEELQKQLKQLDEEADKHIVHDEFERLVQRAGGVAFNADTAWDRTRYYYSLPANRLEFWMGLESDRFVNPVLREFYREREVVAEERRLGENDPQGRLIEDFFATMYKAHPYGEPVVGHASDIRGWTRQQAQDWFRTYYGPSNLTIAVVGDVDPAEVRRHAQVYFGRLPKTPQPEPVDTVEPEQEGERRCSVVAQSQPLVVVGFHRPGFNHPDNAVFDALTDIVSEGRTSRLYRSLVRDQRISIFAGATPLTGVMDRYPSLFLFVALPAPGHTNEDNEAALLKEIERLKTGNATPEELAKARNRARARLIRQLNSNLGLAHELVFYQAISGDWRNLFVQLDRIDRVTAEDITRVARKYFTAKNRTVGCLIPEEL